MKLTKIGAQNEREYICVAWISDIVTLISLASRILFFRFLLILSCFHLINIAGTRKFYFLCYLNEQTAIFKYAELKLFVFRRINNIFILHNMCLNCAKSTDFSGLISIGLKIGKCFFNNEELLCLLFYGTISQKI